MVLDILAEKGIPLPAQRFRWRSLAAPPYSKLDDDAFTRVRVLLVGALEAEAARFGHAAARCCAELRGPLAEVRRIETFQRMTAEWLHPADASLLEAALGQAQAAVEVAAAAALAEPDPYQAQVFRFGLVESVDHLYRFGALLDRLDGQDPNAILQCYTDLRPGRPTALQHRHPLDDLREPYDRATAVPLSRIHPRLLLAMAHRTREGLAHAGPACSDPLARMLCGEIAAVAEQHATQYGALLDPAETWLEQWLLLEAAEVLVYWSCLRTETSARLKPVWEEGLQCELGHLHLVMDLVRRMEGRDPEAILPRSFDQPLGLEAHRSFIRDTLAAEEACTAAGTRLVPREQEPPDSRSIRFRRDLNADGAPSQDAAQHYRWRPGGELFAETTGDLEFVPREGRHDA